MQLWLVQPFLSRINALVTDLERRVLRQLEISEPDSVLEVGDLLAHQDIRLQCLLAEFRSTKSGACFSQMWLLRVSPTWGRP